MKKTTRYSALAIALLLLMASMCGCQSGIGKELATSWRMMTGGEQEDPAHELFEEMKEEAEAKKEEIEPAEQLDLLVSQEPGCPDCRDRKTMIEPFKYSFFMGNDDATMKKMYREYRKNYLTTLPLNISEVNNYRYALLLEEEDFSHYDPVRNAGDLEIPYNIGESLNADGQNGFVTPKEFQEMPNGPEDKKKIIDLVTEFMELEYSDS